MANAFMMKTRSNRLWRFDAKVKKAARRVKRQPYSHRAGQRVPLLDPFFGATAHVHLVQYVDVDKQFQVLVKGIFLDPHRFVLKVSFFFFLKKKKSFFL